MTRIRWPKNLTPRLVQEGKIPALYARLAEQWLEQQGARVDYDQCNNSDLIVYPDIVFDHDAAATEFVLRYG